MLEIKQENPPIIVREVFFFFFCFYSFLSCRSGPRFLYKGGLTLRERGRGGKPAISSPSGRKETKVEQVQTPESSFNLSPWSLSPRRLEGLARGHWG
jgi:hypothetical protein